MPASVFLALSLSACASSSPKTATEDPELCPKARSQLRVFGDDRLIEHLERSRLRSAQLVRYAPAEDGCGMTLELLQCTAPGAYRYRARMHRGITRVKSNAARAAALPLLPLDASRESSWEFTEREAGRWSRRGALSTAALKGDDCARATHVIEGFTVGAYRAAETTIKGRTKLWTGGQLSRCRGGKRPPRGCKVPLEIALKPITDDAPAKAAPVQKRVAGLDQTEVSAMDYATCVKAGRCPAAGTGARCTAGHPRLKKHPANCVSWAGAKAYCAFKGEHLPSALEWLRGAGGARFSWGEAWPPPKGAGNLADESTRARWAYWDTIPGYKDGYAATAPVGFSTQDAGVHDLAGNVMEWTSTRQKGGVVVRGSSFGQAREADIDLRGLKVYRADHRSAHIGFRCAR